MPSTPNLPNHPENVRVVVCLHSARESLDSLIKATPPAPLEQVAARTALDELGVAIGDLVREGSIAKYESYDEWARHFSVVRMTVVPFGITTSIAILAWGWDRGEILCECRPFWARNGIPLFPMLAFCVWFATFVLMCSLTERTYYYGRKMLHQAWKAGINPIDESVGFRRGFWTDWPFRAVVIASVGLLIAWGNQLSHFNGIESPTKVQLVKPDLRRPMFNATP
jgi:hypothetical protein